MRIDQGRIGPGQKPAARLALENLRVLLGRVGMEEREEVLEVDTVGSAEAAIRRKVELELAAAGRKASLVPFYFICDCQVGGFWQKGILVFPLDEVNFSVDDHLHCIFEYSGEQPRHGCPD